MVIGIVLAFLALLAAGAYAAWRHHLHLRELQRRLAWSEDSRLELEERAEAVDVRLALLADQLAAQQRALAEREAAARRESLERLIDSAPRNAAATPTPTAWADTQPAPEAHYAPTQPAPLEH